MPTPPHAPDAVLRFSEVTLSKEAFEAILTLRLDRFEPSRAGIGHYAQINLPDGSSWEDLAGLINRIGPLIQPYMLREMGRPHVDAALYFDYSSASTSMLIPCAVALAVGRWGFDFEVSAYLMSSD